MCMATVWGQSHDAISRESMQVMVIMFGIIFGLCFAFLIPCISENKVMPGGKLLHISTKRNKDTEKTNIEMETV